MQFKEIRPSCVSAKLHITFRRPVLGNESRELVGGAMFVLLVDMLSM
jgi:hypothetical protein